jgi:F-type H+-transporting ATPase subunit gamma
MTEAKSNVSKMLDELIARSRQLRQEEITNEIIELGGRRARGRASRRSSDSAGNSLGVGQH